MCAKVKDAADVVGLDRGDVSVWPRLASGNKEVFWVRVTDEAGPRRVTRHADESSCTMSLVASRITAGMTSNLTRMAKWSRRVNCPNAASH